MKRTRWSASARTGKQTLTRQLIRGTGRRETKTNGWQKRANTRNVRHLKFSFGLEPWRAHFTKQRETFLLISLVHCQLLHRRIAGRTISAEHMRTSHPSLPFAEWSKNLSTLGYFSGYNFRVTCRRKRLSVDGKLIIREPSMSVTKDNVRKLLD